MKEIKLVLIVFALFLVGFVACNDESDDFTSGKGTINIHLTDAPFPIDLVAKTIVNIDKVEIKTMKTDSTDESFTVISEEAMEIDLLELSNGVTELIGSAELDAGVYDQIRMHVVDAKVILNDESEFDLKVPSGSQSGLKILLKPALEISEGQTVDVLLDFDVSKSFIVKGNYSKGKVNGFMFKPVVRAVHMGMAGRIEGNVSDTSDVNLENVAVKVWLPGAVEDSLITSSFTNVDGNYKAIGLPEATYFLTAELEGFKSDTIKDVVVTAGSSTVVDFELEPEESSSETGGE